MDAFDLYRARGILLAPGMRVDPSSINESVAVLVGSFGDDQLRAIVHGEDRASPYHLVSHPVGSAIRAPHEDGIARVLEIAEYLKFAAPSPDFATLVSGLRHQFDTTRLQLAMGLRLERADATRVEFEPLVLGGRRGDISFIYDDYGYIAECFVPGPVKHRGNEVEWLTKQVVEGLPRDFPIAVGVRLERLPKADERTRIVRTIHELANDIVISDTADEGRGSRIATLKGAVVSVCRTVTVGPAEPFAFRSHPTFESFTEPDVVVGARLAPKAAVFRTENPSYEGDGSHNIAVWLPDEYSGFPTDLAPTLEHLTPKLKRKLAQTKHPDHPGRVLFVEHWLEGHLNRASEEALTRMSRALFDDHKGIEGVVLCGRLFDDQQFRMKYAYRPLYPRGASGRFESLIDEVIRLEEEVLIPPQR